MFGSDNDSDDNAHKQPGKRGRDSILHDMQHLLLQHSRAETLAKNQRKATCLSNRIGRPDFFCGSG